MIPLPSFWRSTNSRASCSVVISAPRATSITSSNPSARIAAKSCSTLPGNCHAAAGATTAVSFSPARSAQSSCTSCDFSITAEKGHARKHAPQKMHLAKSMRAWPCASLRMAPTGHAASQGTDTSTIAL